jgi:hypothetical protein
MNGLSHKPIDIRGAIWTALDSFSHNEPWWSGSIVRALDEAQRGLAFQWARRCVRKLLPLLASEKTIELLADLDRLDLLTNQSPSSTAIGEMASQIWYREDRDNAQTAVSKLYEAFAIHLAAPDRTSIPALAAPLDVLLSGDRSNVRSDRAVEFRDMAIAEFLEVANEFNNNGIEWLTPPC